MGTVPLSAPGVLEEVADAMADVIELAVVEESRELMDVVDDVEVDTDVGTLCKNAGSGLGILMVAMMSLNLG